ncbi:hypothetical protein GTID1_07700 [Geobacillus thermodenitrificans]|jgi:Holliday junction resolvasome RuvABC DNA-binding subunit|nr:hypothetical protein GTHT12_03564 [Geobacillus thermodenitrificans]ATO37105.1 hypothetical protein GTID1_07700 [Geobacillus thermodenitrificans]
MRPFDKDLELIDKIPGVNRQSAGQILAEIDTDMSRSFPRTISFYGLGWLRETMKVQENEYRHERKS